MNKNFPRIRSQPYPGANDLFLPQRVRQKLESGVQTLLGQTGQASPVIGSLYSLDYPGFEDPSPELWKTRLFDVVRNLLATLAGSKPTVICLEDLHWADPPFL